mgnify:FL=1
MKKKRARFYVHLSGLTVALILIATAVAVTGCIAFHMRVYSRALIRDAKVNSEQTVNQTALSVSNYLDSLKSKIDNMRAVMSECESAEEFAQKMSVFCKLENDIYSVMVYDTDGNLLLSASDGLELKENIFRDLSFDKALFESASDYAVSKPHVQVLFENKYPWVVTIGSAADSELFGKSVYLAMDFRFYEIAKYIDNVGVGRHGYCYVADRYGNIVYHPQQQLIYAGLKDENAKQVSELPDGVHSENNIIYTLKTTSDGLWRVVGVNYTDELAVERRTQVLNAVLIAVICCAAVSAVTLFLFSRLVNAPVKSLVSAMRKFEKSAKYFEYNGDKTNVAEFKELYESFSHMSLRIKQLVERVKRDQTALRKTELKALQAQINPHFLYNTLDSIQWTCENGDTENAVKMVGALARLFRISISRGREFITIKEEMEHARSYLVIQSFRYSNQFSYSFDVDSNLESYLCNKITVQPLIENAIYHGIDRTVDEGEIKIAVKQAPDCEDDILITVSDNGVGMTEEQCKKVLQKEKSDSSGIGVKNVNDRLEIYFGRKYGISIESELDVGTVVTVRIPKITKEPESDA